MIKSMTGYASEHFNLKSTRFFIEIKSLNSKYLDLKIKLPSFLDCYEYEIRKNLGKKIIRGKAELNLLIDNDKSTGEKVLNKKIINHYIKDLKDVNSDSNSDFLGIALTLPNSIGPNISKLNKNDINAIKKKISTVFKAFDKYRSDEGEITLRDIKKKLLLIKKLRKQITKIEIKRVLLKKNTIKRRLKKLKIEVDFNRFEQELIYFIEKYDINEELIRLESNLRAFDRCLELNKPNGKKLGFISQELSREINTIGSKCNDATIQKYVIEMKDNLEKIRENILNIL